MSFQRLVEGRAEHWDEALAAWFLAKDFTGTAPFMLAPWAKVVDPALFFKGLRDEVELGPTGTRARLGGTMQDLARLRELFP